MNPPICNGCGNESPEWHKLCEQCERKVTCQNCGGTYKRGQGLQEVDICSSCLQEVFAKQDEEEEEIFRPTKKSNSTEYDDSFNDFDYPWELK